jgi:uncharacterized RDD family membrane protein YckC
MNISLRHLFLIAAVAVSTALTPAAFAQENKTAAPAEPAAAKPAVAPPADAPVAPSADQPAAPVAQPEPAAPAAAKPPPVAEPAVAPAAAAEPEAKSDDEADETPKLRRLDTDETTETPEAPKTPKTRKEIIHERIERAHQRAAAARANRVGRDIVNVFSDSDLPKGEKADSVVAIFGSATAEGDATDAVVSVFGNTRANGAVGDAAVAVLGDNEVNGTVGDAMVTVLGNATVNGHVRGDVVAVLGDIKLGPAAVVDGQVVCVGGTVTKDPAAVLKHSVQNVGMGHGMHGLVGLKAWVRECFLYGRPLAFAPNLMWAWWIALACLAFYVVLALLFGKGVNRCVDNFEQRPGYSILTALLTLLLGPIAIILLAITGIGIAVIPFLAAGLFFASLFGKAVMLAWIGRRIGKLIGTDNPALAVLFGGVIVLFLYTVPVVGFITYKLLGWIGVGVVVYTLLGNMKREKPVVPPAPGPGPVDPAVAAASLAAGGIALPPPVLQAVSLPRAGFWIRTAALLLDVIIVALICSLLSEMFSSGSHIRIRADLLPSLALYGALMWKLKGSTVGGIVCGLKVVRLDDRPIDWGTSIVRALSCFLSLAVMGLGFIWVVFDDQRQSWHDKIAGTVVVRAPRGVSLV